MTHGSTPARTRHDGHSRGAARVRAAVDALLEQGGPLVLAVSGGRDSMCLLHAVGARYSGASGVTVATFDHGTGPHATEAARLVIREGRALGFEVVSARAWGTVATEAAWRQARWGFLRTVARGRKATIATAHSYDDHIETVVMRLLRGSGGRGLAGLRAPSGRVPPLIVTRPLLDLKRAELARWAVENGVPWVDDPSNNDLRYLRNRVRRDLIPALATQDPALFPALDQLSRQLAGIRARLQEVAGDFVIEDPRGLLDLSVDLLHAAEPARRVLWAELLESVGIVLDRRGYVRLGRLGLGAETGTMIPASGGVAVTRMRDRLIVHPTELGEWASVPLTNDRVSKAGNWVFRWGNGADTSAMRAVWYAVVPSDQHLTARPWVAGDRWRGPGAGAPRLVSRYLAEAGIPPTLRKGWPVVERNGEIVWVPGVRRAFAAPAPSGRPTALLCCEPDYR